MTPLETRISNFKNLGQVQHKKVYDLIYEYKIRRYDMKMLKLATCLYMSKSINKDLLFLDDRKLLEYYVSHYNELKNITPNGLIVPKRHSILEYNLLNQAFYRIIGRLNIDKYITSWHVPLNLRIKLGEAIESNLERSHPTEHIHTDSWAGESTFSVTTMIPIFGDTDRNYVNFFTCPEDFQEEWLGPRPSYKDGSDIAQKYKKIDYVAQKGRLILSDFATMHSSSRKEGAGVRVSIDTTFALKRDINEEVIHEWRENERASTDVVNNIGSRYLFVFPDGEDDQVSSAGGFKHPTNLHIKQIVNNEN